MKLDIERLIIERKNKYKNSLTIPIRKYSRISGRLKGLNIP